jgi:hypothetical protein
LAIAEAAGEDWPTRARVSAVTLVTEAAEREPSLGIRLLTDLREVFAECDQMATSEILLRLTSLKEAPWADMKGRPLNDRGLATRLRQYGVKSRTLNLGGDLRAKGYAQQDLYDAWERYLPPSPDRSVTSVTSVPKPGLQGPKVTDVTADERSVTDDGDDENPDKIGIGTDVTDVTAVAGDGGNGGSIRMFGAIVTIREIWVPPLGPEGDDVYDIDPPGWRQ